MRVRLLRSWRCATLGLCAGLVLAAGAQDPLVLTFDAAETAVLDPVNWDQPIPGERYFDALRGMLVRFPGVAEAIHARLAQGHAIESAALILEWERQEGARPERGRSGWGSEDKYTNDSGRWHAMAWALRHPWSAAEEAVAPTFNAYVNGLGFWDRGGARGDGTDRHAEPFGPQPLHAEHPTAQLDVTSVLTETAIGATLGERLRAIEECGFLVHKHELYDLKYMDSSGYDWAIATGYMRLWVAPPQLVVRLRPAADAEPGRLPPAVDMAAFVATLEREGGRGQPSLAMPPDLAERAAPLFARPGGMPDWQWARVDELMNLGNPGYIGRFNIDPLRGRDEEAYLAAMRDLMQRPPRFWYGHLTTDLAIVPARYGELLPPAVMDHLTRYWTAWLHPELASARDLPNSYVDGEPSRDGVPSYFRGYAHGGGTMNFGHNAVMGTLLGAQLLGAEHPLRDARRGVQRLLRGWGIGTGAHQEVGDTYYQALTLCAAAAIAHHAEDPLDALSARVHLGRLLEMVISMYHPALRRTVHPQGRGQLESQFLFQDAPYHILHSLSRDGVLMHLDAIAPDRTGRPANDWGHVHGISVLGGEGPPARVAMLSPWVETSIADAIAEVVDRKPFPWRVHARSFNPGERAGWHVNYMRAHYAIGSRDNAVHSSGVYSAVAQWRRAAERVNHVDDLGALFLSAGVNGEYRGYTGYYNLLQHDHIILAMKEQLSNRRLPDEVRSLHASALILAHGDTSGREVWIGDRLVENLGGPPETLARNWRDQFHTRGEIVHFRSGETMAVKDGLTYMALIPLAIHPLHREHHATVSYAYPALLVHSFFYHGEAPADVAEVYAGDSPPSAGFIIVMGDETQYGSFAAFREALREARVTLRGDDDDAAVSHLAFSIGDDVLEMGCRVNESPAYRRINGAWPYLSEGVMRRSDWAIQSSTGETELHGAVIRHEPGRHAYLQVIPTAGVTIAHHALPELSRWELTTPDARRIAAAGRIGLARVIVQAPERRLAIDHAYPRDVDPALAPDVAQAMLLFGFDDGWQFTVNNRRLDDPLAVDVDGRPARVLPLTDHPVDAASLLERYRNRD